MTAAVLTTQFGYAKEYCGPVVETVEKQSEGVCITFTHADGLHFDGDMADLKVYDAAGNELDYAVVIHENRLFIAAEGIARIELGWRNACVHNLYNEAGWLASPFEIVL